MFQFCIKDDAGNIVGFLVHEDALPAILSALCMAIIAAHNTGSKVKVFCNALNKEGYGIAGWVESLQPQPRNFGGLLQKH